MRARLVAAVLSFFRLADLYGLFTTSSGDFLKDDFYILPLGVVVCARQVPQGLHLGLVAFQTTARFLEVQDELVKVFVGVGVEDGFYNCLGDCERVLLSIFQVVW